MFLRFAVALTALVMFVPQEAEAQCSSFPQSPTCQVVMVSQEQSDWYWNALYNYQGSQECMDLVNDAIAWGEPQWTSGFGASGFFDHTNQIYGINSFLYGNVTDAQLVGQAIHEMAHYNGMNDSMAYTLQQNC